MGKKILTIGLVVVFLIVFAVMMLNGPKVEHIEDTNGPDIYTLHTITDANIIERNIGGKGLTIVTNNLTNTTEYKSDKFTGVEEIYGVNIKGNRMDITLTNIQVRSGNFKAVVVYNDEIVHEFKNNEMMETFTLQRPDGYVAIRIAGESADFYLTYDLI